MNPTKKVICFQLIFLVLAIGCIPDRGNIQKINHYTLEYEPPRFEGLTPLSSTIRVGKFQASPFYNSDRISYQENPFQREQYFYHKWRAKPKDLAAYFLARDIRASSLFKAVFGINSHPSSSHVIEGSVDEFFERDKDNLREAVLSISITLMKENEPDVSKRILLQKQYSARSACEKRNPQSLAEAMSRAMSKVSEMIITDIYRSIAKADVSNG